MNFKFLPLVLIILSNTAFGQIPKKAIAIEDESFDKYFFDTKSIPIVKGKIINLAADEINQFKIDYSVVTILGQDKKTASLKPDGSFELELDYAFPYQQMWIHFGNLFYAGVYANTDLFIELNAQILKSQNHPAFNSSGVKYLGKDGALNTYTSDHILFERRKQLDISRAIQKVKSENRGKIGVNSLAQKIDSLYSVLHKIDNEYIKQNPSEFSWIVTNERQSQQLGELATLFWYKVMPSDYFDKIKNHKAYLTSNEGTLFYRYFSIYLQSYTSLSKQPQTTAGLVVQTSHLLDSLFIPSKSDLMKLHFTSKDPNEQKLMYDNFLPTVKTNWCRNFIRVEYDNTSEKITTVNEILEEANKITKESKPFVSDHQLGQPIMEMPFGAKLYKVDSLNAETLLSNLKKSFQNKALIIDFWATWCGPCIEEFKEGQQIHDDAKDLPVEFVYLCTSSGSDIDKWKTKIAEYKLTGTHIYVEKSIESKLMEMFSASGFPSYVLINAKGEYKPGAISRVSYLTKDQLSELIK